VLLVHGQPGSGADWRNLARLLVSDHRVVAPDRPGWGQNPLPATGLAENAAALAGIVHACALSPPVTVVGHSLGGGIALELALHHPELVGAVVLIGSVGVGLALGRLDRLLVVPMVGNGIVRAGVVALRGTVAAARRFPDGSRPVSAPRRLGRMVAVVASLDASNPVGGRARKSFLVEQKALVAQTPSLERRLSRLAVPVAVVHGAADRVVPLAAGRLLAEQIPGAELVTLGGAGHSVPSERPALVAPVVARYARLAAGMP
jgi:pimeloyl-ACP methyl ester carboxylesterase